MTTRTSLGRSIPARRGGYRAAPAAVLLLVLIDGFTAPNVRADATAEAGRIQTLSGVQGGLVVHVGCGDAALTAALRRDARFLVHGLDADAQTVAAAREALRAKGLYGPISIDRFTAPRLPYVDNLVNLAVIEDPGTVSLDEVLRVLCPGGAACFRRDGGWEKVIKPRPDAIDEWSHYLHSASGNAVSRDLVVGPPRRLQWVGSPLYSRHHDRMSSVSAVVSAGGRVFTIFDEATPASILVAPQWALIARDAFNGMILWKRGIDQWHTHLWPLKSGPAQLPRRLVASATRVYATLSLDGPVTALDAASGETVRTYADTAATEEILLDRGVLYLRVKPEGKAPQYADLQVIASAVKEPFYDEEPRQIMAVEAESGKVLWSVRRGVLPGTLAVGADGVFFHDGQSVVALARDTGRDLWRSEPVDRQRGLRSLYMPTLVAYEDVLLFAGKGRTAGDGGRPRDQLVALSAKTGALLWQADHPPSGYQSPGDVLVAGGLVWTGETTVGSGVFTGRDPRTGEVKAQFPPDTDVFWFHHRCHRGKATENYLLMSRTGIEFVDFRKQQWLVNHWVRGACLYGVMPANGLLYAPQHPCACYLETKLSGFNALAPASSGPRVPAEIASLPRLERGPAYDAPPGAAPAAGDWPTYRGDPARSGHARTAVPPAAAPRWQTRVGGALSSPVIAGGRVFIASGDTHTVHALDAADGRPLWSVTVGGRVDSPPTVHAGRVLFGSADGMVTCLRASDGALAWRFRAAPMDERVLAFEELQSAWPVHGSVLVRDGVLWAVAGRSVFLDGGLRLWRLDPLTGSVLSETVLDDKDPLTGKDRHDYVSWLNMPAGLNDVLSSDDRHVYMRSQAFLPDGRLRPLEAHARTGEGHGGSSFAPPPNQDAGRAHLFSPTGFLDDTWWHRTYWLYGSHFYSGWSAYYLSGKVVPAGRILAFDDTRVYGFGRKPQYYRWTTPIEHHLFAADKTMPEPMSVLPGKAARTGSDAPADAASAVVVPRSESLNPAGKPLAVEARVRAEDGDGVILAHGGHSQGYALFLQQGRPRFAVRVSGNLGVAAGTEPITGRWCHLVGVLTADKALQLYVDGALAASVPGSGLVPSHPAEGMEIGTDGKTPVGEYRGSAQFQGVMEAVSLHHRALAAAEIAERAAAKDATVVPSDGLVLAYRFGDGKAMDASGAGNHGTPTNVKPAEGRAGAALRFGGGEAAAAARALVNHQWSVELPLLPRAMVLTEGTLFIAGPPDLVDEEQAARSLADPATRENLAAYAESLAGRRGAALWAVAVADGRKLSEHPLDVPPVFDGMAAAGGRLFLSTVDGRVLCFGP